MPDLEDALRAFDGLNAEDPNVDVDEAGDEHPKELLYARRMSETLDAFSPNASDELRLACRAQHLERWRSPRSDFPAGREGYLRWRSEAKKDHARRAGAVLEAAGFGEDVRRRVATLIEKRGLRTDAEVQCLEDVVCLVFLRYYWNDFRRKHEADKLVGVLRKTWAKMSEAGHAEALRMSFDSETVELLRRAGVLD